MKNLLLLSIIVATTAFGQQLKKPSSTEIASLPLWAQRMYESDPNVFEVDALYENYYETHLFEKNYHTQYYKRWRRSVDDFIQTDGHYSLPSDSEKLSHREQLMSNHNGEAKSGTWTLHGPIVTFNTNGQVISEQANIYCIDQAPSDASVLYCGTEPGEIYKSIDGGTTWLNVSLNDPLSGGIGAIEIHPGNPDVALAGSGGILYKTTDGGANWTNVLSGIGYVNEIVFIPSSPTIVLAATDNGLYRSTNAGDNWVALSTERSHDIKLNTGNDNIVYLLRTNSAEDRCEFFISTDLGLNFTQITNGWYYSTDAGRNDGGARLAVSDADPSRVYAYLIGEAKTGDTGFIGVYRSTDGGYTWTLPNGPTGGPYDANHQNLAIGSPTWQYHQGFYNCGLMASNTNPDEILVGGLNLYKSDDAGLTFYPLAGYVGGSYDMHVDMQDFRNFGTTTWITTDGGIYRSTDFFNTNGYESRMYGIHSSDYWGFGQGWNQDVTIGGLYHNGNMTSFENWGTTSFLQLGGGEPASGYVNPGENRRVYSSDINGRILPLNIGDPIDGVGFGIDPNESYWSVESTELEFDPRCYSIAYAGLDNQLWYSDDAGVSFYLKSTFGSVADDEITYIEIAWSNPDIMYVCQQIGSNAAKLWKTTDDGANWGELTLPSIGNERTMLIQVNPEDENDVWIAFEAGPNGQKIFQSLDGGSTWNNKTTSTLNGQSARWIAYIGGSDDGIYYATNETIFYRNAGMADWDDFGDGLPVQMPTNITRPFYRDGKIRIGSYGKGIWESPLYEPQDHPVAQISVDKIETLQHCEVDTFHYVDHSMLNHTNATWEWTFQGGSPATANTWAADVSYSGPGTYLTILTITDANGQSDTDSLYVEIEAYVPSPILNEDFESGFPDPNWEFFNADNGQTWELSTAAGGFGNSTNSMIIRGYDYWPGGDEDDIRVSIDMSALENAELIFDVAYARYAVNYSDSLEILVSTDCGANFNSHYYKGGSDLATAPDNDQFFVPAAGEWRTDTVDLSAYYGFNDVMIAFRSHTGWGNNVYVDNINLSGLDHTGLVVLESNGINVFPSLLESGNLIHVRSELNEELEFSLLTSNGKLVMQEFFNGSADLEPKNLACGTYLYVVRSSNQIKRGKIVIR